TPVDPALIERLAVAAARAPSGGNVQPWHIDIVTGDALARLKADIGAKLLAGHTETPAYDIYPKGLAEPYNGRRYAVGEG
ncbi:nitroreductase family protein, partial [Acinetobacter baumannii]